MDARFVTACSSPSQFPDSNLPEIAIVGRSNCGKSSLINALTQHRSLARTSSTAGRTQQIFFFEVNWPKVPPFMLVDLPGYGYAKTSKRTAAAWGPLIDSYIDQRDALIAVLLLIDVRREVADEERGLVDWINERDLQLELFLTKADKLNKTKRFSAAQAARRELGLARSPIAVSTLEKQTVAACRQRVSALLRASTRPAPNPSPTVVGLTGGIAAGKSSVARMFAERGVSVVDADQLARAAVAPGTQTLAKIVELFGRDVLDEHGALRREVLGERVFSDADARRKLEEIMHPAIAELSGRAFAELAERGVRLVLYEAALLVETGRYQSLDGLIVVAADDDVRIARLMARDQLTREAAERRLAAQLPQRDKIALADYLIDNGGAIDQTEAQVEAVLSSLASEHRLPLTTDLVNEEG